MNELAWETECLQGGADRYFNKQDSLRAKQRGDETDVGHGILLQFIPPIGEWLRNYMRPTGGHSKFKPLLAQYENMDNAAFVGLKLTVQAVLSPLPRDADVTVLCSKIGRYIESDMKFTKFHAEMPYYYEAVLKSLATQLVTSYDHKHRTLSKKFADFQLAWDDWGNGESIGVGGVVLAAVMHVMFDAGYMFAASRRSGIKTTRYIDTTVEFDDDYAEIEAALGAQCTISLPCKAPPRDWECHEGLWTGGFHHPRLASVFPLVPTRTDDHAEYVRSNPPLAHAKAVNILQRTAWRINEPVVEFLRECIQRGRLPESVPPGDKHPIPPVPPIIEGVHRDDMTPEQLAILNVYKGDCKAVHFRNKTDKARLLLIHRSISATVKLAGEPFYFVYYCDFRGRVYCASTDITPQGADSVKALLCFNESKPCGDAGLFWLAVHGANKYGYDKHSYEDRVDWVYDNQAAIEAICDNPFDSAAYSFLADADKPFLFYAFCLEWRASNYGDDRSFESRLAVGLDGSCNGLQHYSAILRDPVGAAATNLGCSKVPQDIYQDVADRTLELLRREVDPMAAVWLDAGIDRKLAKRPVMTLPYGSTQQSARGYIRDWMIGKDDLFPLGESESIGKYALYLTPILWKAIGETVVAARTGMQWLRAQARAIVKSGSSPRWLTPNGFPVFQSYQKWDTISIKTQILGRMDIRVRESGPELDARSQGNGIAPNFIHSLDATHLVNSVIEAVPAGVTALLTVHDDYGTHPCDTPALFRVIREQFVAMYDDASPMSALIDANQGVTLDELPEEGDFDLTDVLKSEFFFG